MKKRIYKIWVTGMIGILSVAGAVISASAFPDLETLFYTYSQDNMVFDYYMDNYVYSSFELDDYNFDGLLALEQIDLNIDGIEELLVIRLKGEMQEYNGYQENENDVIAEIYQYQGDRLQRIAQYTIADRVLRYNADRVDVFWVNGVSGPVLCCEKKEIASLFANGEEWQFTAVAFDGTQFVEISSAVLEGSGWSEEEEIPVWNALAAVGLYPSDIIRTSVADQIGNLKMLNSIRRYMITEYDEINQFMSDGTEKVMQYGQTCFHSYVNEGIQNKMNGVFSKELSTKGVELQEDDYIIPGTDSRYITEADLVHLSAYDILLARNEIYARHGYIFNNEELDAYFRSKSWYIPSVSGLDFTEEYAAQVFNEYEMVNIGTIVQYENAHELNQF